MRGAKQLPTKLAAIAYSYWHFLPIPSFVHRVDRR
jgi:hypothetical protein